ARNSSKIDATAPPVSQILDPIQSSFGHYPCPELGSAECPRADTSTGARPQHTVIRGAGASPPAARFNYLEGGTNMSTAQKTATGQLAPKRAAHGGERRPATRRAVPLFQKMPVVLAGLHRFAGGSHGNYGRHVSSLTSV